MVRITKVEVCHHVFFFFPHEEVKLHRCNFLDSIRSTVAEQQESLQAWLEV